MNAVAAAVMIAVNVWGVPRYGYIACAWGGFAGYGTAMLLSFVIGRRYYPVPYDLRKIALFVLLAAVLAALYRLPALLGKELPVAAALALGTVLLAAYCAAAWKLVKTKKI